MITRDQYMADSENLHHAYYLEIALAAEPLALPFSVDQCRDALANGDEHLNTLPLSHWDGAVRQYGGNGRMSKALKDRGDFLTLGTGVCVLKALAKHRATPKMIAGTDHFVSYNSALRYFAYENATDTDIDRKIAEGLIQIGKPALKPGQKLSIIDDGTRYAIEG